MECPGWRQVAPEIQGSPDGADFGFLPDFASPSPASGNGFASLPTGNTFQNPQTSPVTPSSGFSSGVFVPFSPAAGDAFAPLPIDDLPLNPEASRVTPSPGFSSGGFAPFSPANAINPSPSFNSPYIGPPVDFQLITGSFTSCGQTCRRTTATLKNVGSQTAHDVRIVMEVRNNADKVMYINGGPIYERKVGELAGGQSVDVPISVNVDCPDLMNCYNSLPFTLHYSVVSTEYTKKFPDILFSG